MRPSSQLATGYDVSLIANEQIFSPRFLYTISVSFHEGIRVVLQLSSRRFGALLAYNCSLYGSWCASLVWINGRDQALNVSVFGLDWIEEENLQFCTHLRHIPFSMISTERIALKLLDLQIISVLSKPFGLLSVKVRAICTLLVRIGFLSLLVKFAVNGARRKHNTRDVQSSICSLGFQMFECLHDFLADLHSFRLYIVAGVVRFVLKAAIVTSFLRVLFLFSLLTMSSARRL